MSHPPLSIPELVLKNANDVVHTFFNGVNIDFKGHIKRWAEKYIPVDQIKNLMPAIEKLRAIGPISKEELAIFAAQEWKNVDIQPRYRLWGDLRSKYNDLWDVATELGFMSADMLKEYLAEPRDPILGPNFNQRHYADIDIFWKEVLPVLINNEHRLKYGEWKNLHKVLTAERLSRRSIYEIIVDHIDVYADEYKAAAVVAIATAVSYYLYKLYKSGVSPKQVKAKVIQDSQKIRESAIKNSNVLKKSKHVIKTAGSSHKRHVTKMPPAKSSATLRLKPTAPSKRK